MLCEYIRKLKGIIIPVNNKLGSYSSESSIVVIINRTWRIVMKIRIMLIITFVFLSGCGPSTSFEGIYNCPDIPKVKFEFKDGGEGYATIAGQKIAIEYEIEKENLLLAIGGQTRVLSIKGNSLESGVYGICTKN